METAEIILLTIFLGLIVFLIGIYIGVVVAMEQDEERKKERWRKTEAYKLGREEEKQNAQKSALDISCVLSNLSDQEIERLEEKENLSDKEKDKLLKLLRRKIKRLKTANQNQQLVIEALKNKGGDENVQQSDID